MSGLSELFEFLHAPNPDARELALANLAGHTPKTAASRNIFVPSGGTPVWKDLQAGKGTGVSESERAKVEMLEDLKTLCRDQAMIAHDAFSSLVNLSDSILVARHLVDEEFLAFLVSFTATHTATLSSLAAMLLSNITFHPSLTPLLSNLTIPIISIPATSSTDSTGNSDSSSNKIPPPPYYFPLSRSGSSTIHPGYRSEMEAEGTTVTRVEAVRALVQAFEDGSSEGVAKAVEGAKRKGTVHFLASVFANISMVPSTRPLLLLPFPAFPTPITPETISPEDEPLLTKIVVYTEHPDTIRRGGALGCIKNAAMDRASHPFLLATEADRVQHPTDPKRKIKGVDVLPWVLSPLMGPEEIDIEEGDALPETLQFLGPDKVRERDPVLRMMCVEILLLLATSFTGRASLRERGTYTVIKLANEAEEDDKIQDQMIRLVGLLKRDEGQDTQKDVVEGLVRVNGQSGADGEEDEGDSDLEIEVI